MTRSVQKRDERTHDICAGYARGNCQFGDSCRFSHDAIRISHDGYFKLWSLTKPQLERKFAVIMLDEAQDAPRPPPPRRAPGGPEGRSRRAPRESLVRSRAHDSAWFCHL